MDTARRVFVALDFDNRAAAEDVVARLGDAGQAYKVGLELLTSAGPDVVAGLVARGKDVFLDLKLFEIPNSVAGAVRAAGRLGATMVTVHALGGPAILEAAVSAAAPFPALRVVALTVVTSMTNADLARVGVAGTTDEQVVRLAAVARDAGCHGVVASPREAALVRPVLGPGPLIVTPGVQLPGESANEHARAASPAVAVAAGATHLVLGRSITRAADPAAALAQVRDELAVTGSTPPGR